MATHPNLAKRRASMTVKVIPPRIFQRKVRQKDIRQPCLKLIKCSHSRKEKGGSAVKPGLVWGVQKGPRVQILH